MSLHPLTPQEHAYQRDALRAGFALRKHDAGHYVLTDRCGHGIIRATPGTLEEVHAFLAEAETMRPEIDRLRRLKAKAKKLGYRFAKSNWRKDSIDNLGGFQIVDVSRNVVVDGDRFACSLDDVAAFLDREAAS